MVKGLSLGLAEIGKIKIGKKGAEKISKAGNKFRMPTKDDHFTITTLERDSNDDFKVDKRIMKELGENPKELKIMLIYDDIDQNFPTRYARYVGTKCVCSGDGEMARLVNDRTGEVTEITCNPATCPHIKERRCKINGTLNCLLENTNTLGGVYKFRTTSYHSVKQILNSLLFIQRITGGTLAGIPLYLTLSPKHVSPDSTKGMTVYVANIEYRGNRTNLIDTVIDLNQKLLSQTGAIKAIELKTKKIKFADDPEAEIVQEFYPEQQEGYEKEDEAIVLSEEDIELIPVEEDIVTEEVEAEKGINEIKKGVSDSYKKLMSLIPEDWTIDYILAHNEKFLGTNDSKQCNDIDKLKELLADLEGQITKIEKEELPNG